MRKRAEWAAENIGKYIIAIIAGLLVLTLIGIFLDVLGHESSEQACRASVVSRMGLKEVFPDRFARRFPFECKTELLRLPIDPLSRQEAADDEKTREAVMEDIGELMDTCWWMFGNGEYYNVFFNKGGNENLCHVCYLFTISPSTEALKDGIELNTLNEYLYTHAYKPGLLQSGGVNLGAYDTYTYTAQCTPDSSRQSRQLDVQDVLRGERRLQHGIADFSGVFAENTDLAVRRQALGAAVDDIIKKGIQPAIIIIPSLSEKELEEHPALANEILETWEVGDPELNNGLVILFVLYTRTDDGTTCEDHKEDGGKLYYASATGTDAVLSKGAFEDFFLNPIIRKRMREGNPALAVEEFVKALNQELEQKNIDGIIAFQNTYGAYITGGQIGSQVNPDENSYIDAKGVIIFSEDVNTTQKLLPGKRYAISYIAPKWENVFGRAVVAFFTPGGVFKMVNVVKQTKANNELPNAILISEHLELFEEMPDCNIVEED